MVYSTRLTVVYAVFAIIVAALLWTYFGWLILLVGAQLSFYVQNPNYLRMGLTELRMSAVQREQLTLKIMFLIGRAYHDGKTRWTVDSLAPYLGMPGIAISRLVHALEDAHLVTLTDDEHLLPARDLGQITIQEIIDIARNEKSGQVGVAQSHHSGGGRHQQDDGRRLAQELRGNVAQGPDRGSVKRCSICRPGYSPAIIISLTSIEPTRTPPRTSTSLPIAAMLLYMSLRLPAMVISCTG